MIDIGRPAFTDWAVVEEGFRGAIADLGEVRTRLISLAVGRSASDVIPDGHEELLAELSAVRQCLLLLEKWIIQR